MYNTCIYKIQNRFEGRRFGLGGYGGFGRFSRFGRDPFFPFDRHHLRGRSREYGGRRRSGEYGGGYSGERRRGADDYSPNKTSYDKKG